MTGVQTCALPICRVQWRPFCSCESHARPSDLIRRPRLKPYPAAGLLGRKNAGRGLRPRRLHRRKRQISAVRSGGPWAARKSFRTYKVNGKQKKLCGKVNIDPFIGSVGPLYVSRNLQARKRPARQRRKGKSSTQIPVPN